MSGWGGAVKWIEDKVLATMLLVGLAPLMAAIAVAIKMDSPGPVLFRQRRYGFNNEDIEVLKFRTMYHFRPPEVGFVQATRDDPRVTRLGALLRKSSLDELPQLFNVLGGSMSLIGPRPHAIAHNEQFVPLVASYDARHKVKPGITGWAQVNGFRGETDNIEKMRARVEHDIYYIENWSLWFDLKILILTALVVWTHPNAY
jgi:putative colanic acid biosynthesis UDP-glucose lipid carrier transferase